MILPESLSDFEGIWSLERLIRDACAGQLVQADGSAVLRSEGGGLIYDETVTLRIPGQPEMTGTRQYLWQWEGDHIVIYFDDDRYFHTLNLGQTFSQDHYDCPPDNYDALYDFSGWPRWIVRWTVSGSRKSFEMETKYTRR